MTTHGTVTDISIDTTTHQQALRTATHIQQLNRVLLTAHGRAPAQITGNVLSIDHSRFHHSRYYRELSAEPESAA